MTHRPAPPPGTNTDTGSAGARLWLALSLALGLPALLLGWVPLGQPLSAWPAHTQTLALQPDAGWQQAAWTWWTAAWLHGSAQHLHKNLLALALMAALGWMARPPVHVSLAWALAWPLTQIGMLGQPLPVYIGLSGVLHAGVIILALNQVLATGNRRRQIMGALLLLTLILKILMENPWQHTLIRPPGSDINVAPWAHLSGATAGAFFYLVTSVTRLAPSVKRLTCRQRTLD